MFWMVYIDLDEVGDGDVEWVAWKNVYDAFGRQICVSSGHHIMEDYIN